MTLLIHAPNVHSGGGKALLLAVLQAVESEQACTLLADTRLDPRLVPAHIEVNAFTPSLVGRFAAEWHLRSIARRGDVVLCMGNLPPLLGCAARVSVFLQNRYLCDDVSLSGFRPRVRCRLLVERLWLRRCLRSGMRVIVQTASMQDAVRRYFGREALVRPFVPATMSAVSAGEKTGLPRFLYPASAEPHKNHAVLLAAWRLLSRAGIDAELHLTIGLRSGLAGQVEQAVADGVKVVNHGTVDAAEMARLYRTCTALVYPSRLESFGMPLLEAERARLPIVAAELDYVRDVVDPTETFDPDSPVSIARAVRRLLGIPVKPVRATTPAEFIASVVADQG